MVINICKQKKRVGKGSKERMDKDFGIRAELCNFAPEFEMCA